MGVTELEFDFVFSEAHETSRDLEVVVVPAAVEQDPPDASAVEVDRDDLTGQALAAHERIRPHAEFVVSRGKRREAQSRRQPLRPDEWNFPVPPLVVRPSLDQERSRRSRAELD